MGNIMAGENYKIGSNEEKTVRFPDKVETEGIGECIAIGILDHGEKIGYLGHYINRSDQPGALLDQAIESAGSIGDLEVALAGNIPLSEEDVAEIGGDFDGNLWDTRLYGERVLNTVLSRCMGLNRIRNFLQWVPREGSYSMKVNTETDEIEVIWENND